MPDLIVIAFLMLLIIGAIGGLTWGPWREARRTIGKEAWRQYPLKRKIGEYYVHSFALRLVLAFAGLGIGGALAKWYFGR